MQRMSKAAPLCRARFTQHCAEYFRTVVNEVMLRSRNDVYEIEEYLLHRRDNGGVKPCFDLFEYAMNFELPEYISNDINFAVCLQNANDLICLANVRMAKSYFLIVMHLVTLHIRIFILMLSSTKDTWMEIMPFKYS